MKGHVWMRAPSKAAHLFAWVAGAPGIRARCGKMRPAVAYVAEAGGGHCVSCERLREDRLTIAEERALAAVKRLLGRGYSPSLREVAAELQIGVSGAKWIVDALVRKGALEQEAGPARTLRLAG